MKQFYFKMIKIPRLAPFLGILFLLSSQGLQATNFTSVKSGPWNDPTTWGNAPGTAVPGTNVPLYPTTTATVTNTTDTVIIATAHIVDLTISGNYTISGNGIVTIQSGGILNVTTPSTTNYTLTINDDALTLNGTLNMLSYAKLVVNNLTVNTNAAINVSSGNSGFSLGTASTKTLTNYGTITVTPSISFGSLSFPGTINNYGTFTASAFGSAGIGTFTNYSTGTFNYGGSPFPAAMTLDASATGNTVNYTSATSQVIKDTNYYNLNISSSTATAPVNKTWYQSADRTVSGNLTTSQFSKLIVTSASIDVNSVVFLNRGTSYTGANTTLTFTGTAPTGGYLPVGLALISGGVVQSIYFSSPGSGYTTAPTFTIGTTTGTPASATVSLNAFPSVYKFTVLGTTTNNGTIVFDANAGTGVKTFATLNNSGTFTLPLGNLLISNALTTSGTFTLSGTSSLTVAPAATFTITGGTTNSTNLGGRPVTFKSDASGTARFGTLANTTYLTGATNVTVERYIPAKRAFRLLSSPVTTTTSINANWQEGLGTTAGLGTHITGTGGASNGFDPSGTNNASLFTYDNANQLWAEVTSTSTNMLTAGTPYLIMVRGDRTTNLGDNAAAASNTTLRATGTLKTGSVDVSSVLSTAADGFSLIGNPYQSPVDMQATLAAATNLKNFYFVWDPTLGSRGAYVTRDLGASTNNITSNVDNYLQPGQACFVQTNTAAATTTLSFTEANKYTTATNQNVMRAVAPINATATKASPSASIRLTLYNKTALANQGTPSDGAVVLFNEASSNEVDANDCSKMTNLDENLSFNTKGNLLSIEHRAVPTAADEIQLAITQYRAKDYTLVAQGTNVDGVTAYLVDQYTKTSTVLPASGSINYNFTVDPSNANSSAANRFKIIFQDATSATEFTENEVKVYPNPSTGGMVTISLPFIQQESKVSVLNFAGETIYSTTIAAGDNAAINPDKSLALGIYFVKIEQAGKTVTKKLIIK